MKINFAEIKSGPEFISCMIRYGFWVLSSVFIGLAMATGYYEPLWDFYVYFSATFFLYNTIVLASIFYKPVVPLRPYITIPMDVAAISISMLFTDDGPFSPFFLFYAWYFVSYGLRYGRGQLFTAAIISLIAFGVVLTITDTWYSHVYDVIAYIVFLIVMPLYIDNMLRQINRARDEANQANKAKSEFLAAMSHEIRTPMSGIVGISSLLEKTRLDEDQREYVSALQESSIALNALIDDVLDLSKIEAGKYSLDEQQFNLPKTLFGVAQMFTASANSKGLELFLNYSISLPDQVFGDGKRLRQIVLNLVSNAVKFTDHGEVLINVLPAESQDKKGHITVRIEVIDTGPGLEEEQKQKIFEPFYQVAGQQRTQQSGTGLGTTISANLVRLMHGEIGVISKKGHGSTFWFEIPWPYEDAGPDTDVPGKGYPLVVYETHKTNRAILESYCQGLHWQYLFVSNQDDLEDQVKRLVSAGETPIVMLSELSCRENCTGLAKQVRGIHGECAGFAKQLRDIYGKKVRICKIIHLANLHTVSEEERKIFDQLLPLPFTPHRLKKSLLALTGQGPGDDQDASEVGKASIRALNVLVAEDSAINAKVITTFLKQDGHQVEHVENGNLALDALQNKHYDLVLMDMRMPEMGGIEATERWRAIETADKHVSIVALTANATTEDKDNCLAAGMDEFLSKPVNQEQLRELIKSIN